MTDGLALLTGALIIAFFSYERFDRVTDQGGRRLERVVNLLSPNKMRARRIVLRAYFFYASALLIIYLFMCAYAELLPFLGGPAAGDGGDVGASAGPEQSTGFSDSDGAGEQALTDKNAPGADGGFIGIDPSISLSMALIIIGLAPSFPLLQRVETWIRYTSHRLAGIPTQVIGLCQKLERQSLGLRSPLDDPTASNLLIPPSDWERLVRYQRASDGLLTAPADFQDDMQQIFAFGAWILRRKVDLGDQPGRRAFDDLERSLLARTNALVAQLDERARAAGWGGANPDAASPQEAGEVGELESYREAWDRLAGEADDLVKDLHLLLALFVEHNIISFTPLRDIPETDKAYGSDGSHKSERQRIQAQARLEAFLRPMVRFSVESSQSSLPIMPVLVWTTSVILVCATLWSVGPGRYEFALQFNVLDLSLSDGYSRALRTITAAVNQLCVPILIAVMIWESGRERSSWENIRTAHWTRRWPQALLVIVVSWAVTVLLITGLALWQAGLTLSWEQNSERAWRTVWAVFDYQAPLALRGAIFAWLVLRVLDLHEARRVSIWKSLGEALKAAVFMAIVGALTRMGMAWMAIVHNKRNKLEVRPGLDEIDRGLAVYSAINMALTAFVVIFCLSEAMRHARGHVARVQGGASGKPSTDARPKALPAGE